MNREEDLILFSSIFEENNRKIYSLLLNLSGNDAEAQDLTQETFIKAYRKLHTFRKDSSHYTWLYRIAVNCWKNRVRYNKRHGIYRNIPLEYENYDNEKGQYSVLRKLHDDASSTEELSNASEMTRYMTRIIETLKPKYRIPLVLYMNGYSYEEISEITKKGLGTAKSLISRAKVMIKDRICELMKEE